MKKKNSLKPLASMSEHLAQVQSHKERWKLFAIKDGGTDKFGPPIACFNANIFFRMMSDEVQRGQAQWARHPDQFAFYEIGEFILDDGTVINHDSKINLGSVLDFKKSIQVQN